MGLHGYWGKRRIVWHLVLNVVASIAAYELSSFLLSALHTLESAFELRPTSDSTGWSASCLGTVLEHFLSYRRERKLRRDQRTMRRVEGNILDITTAND